MDHNSTSSLEENQGGKNLKQPVTLHTQSIAMINKHVYASVQRTNLTQSRAFFLGNGCHLLRTYLSTSIILSSNGHRPA